MCGFQRLWIKSLEQQRSAHQVYSGVIPRVSPGWADDEFTPHRVRHDGWAIAVTAWEGLA